MKYKLIRAMAHNWSHSLMSGMNYIDGAFVFEDLKRLARERPGQKVLISWIPVREAELFSLTPRVRECLKHYRQALPTHLDRHKTSAEAIAEMRTEVYVAENHHVYVRSYVLDDRGKEHVQFVWSWS